MDVTMANNDLICVDCGSPFRFGDRDRAFYATQGWPAPKRCVPCRQEKKRQYEKRIAADWQPQPR